MSFAWRDYLGLAEALVQARTTLAPEEACCRAAVSRAYYAVYGVARTQARDHEGLQLPATGAAHQQVSLHYRTGPSPRHRAIGERLRQLRRAPQPRGLCRPAGATGGHGAMGCPASTAGPRAAPGPGPDDSSGRRKA
jgi:hypothetical protein